MPAKAKAETDASVALDILPMLNIFCKVILNLFIMFFVAMSLIQQQKIKKLLALKQEISQSKYVVEFFGAADEDIEHSTSEPPPTE